MIIWVGSYSPCLFIVDVIWCWIYHLGNIVDGKAEPTKPSLIVIFVGISLIEIYPAFIALHKPVITFISISFYSRGSFIWHIFVYCFGIFRDQWFGGNRIFFLSLLWLSADEIRAVVSCISIPRLAVLFLFFCFLCLFWWIKAIKQVFLFLWGKITLLAELFFISRSIRWVTAMNAHSIVLSAHTCKCFWVDHLAARSTFEEEVLYFMVIGLIA